MDYNNLAKETLLAALNQLKNQAESNELKQEIIEFIEKAKNLDADTLDAWVKDPVGR